MAVEKLLLEDGTTYLLIEDGSGDVLLESSTASSGPIGKIIIKNQAVIRAATF